MSPQINTYQKLSTLIGEILKSYSNEKGKSISGNHRNLHENFYDLKKKHPEYFMRLRFDTNGHYPISDDLDSILQDFQISGRINKLNPGFKTIVINNIPDNNRKERMIPEVDNDLIKEFAKELSL